MNRNDAYSEWATLRTVILQAVATWMLRDIASQLHDLEADIAGAVRRSRLATAKGDKTRLKAEQDLLADVRQRIADVYREIRRRIEDDMEAVTVAQEEAEERALLLLWGVTLSASASVAASAQRAHYKQQQVLGATTRQWLERQAGDLHFRFTTTLRTGLAAGEAVEEIAGRVTGGKAPAPQGEAATKLPGIAERSTRAAEATIRTGMTTAQDAARRATVLRLPPAMRYGWQQISILDGRTTQVCRAYAFKVWNKDFQPVGHSLPFAGGVPRHHWCRSSIVPFLLEDDPAKDMTFKQWMASLGTERQDKIFGPGRAKLWREGKLPDGELLRQQERVIALDRLRRMGNEGLPPE